MCDNVCMGNLHVSYSLFLNPLTQGCMCKGVARLEYSLRLLNWRANHSHLRQSIINLGSWSSPNQKKRPKKLFI